MNERIKQLWEQAAKTTQGDSWEEQTKFMERFAELVKQDERDKCAQDYLQDCCDAVEAARLEEREWFLKVLYLFEDSYSSSNDVVASIKARVIKRGEK